MTGKELYDAVGGNYDLVLDHIMSEKYIPKFVELFLNDENFTKLVEALEEDRIRDAFTAVHTLKGVCGNLALTELYDATLPVTEGLREGKDVEAAKNYMPALAEKYKYTVDKFKEYLNSLD